MLTRPLTKKLEVDRASDPERSKNQRLRSRVDRLERDLDRALNYRYVPTASPGS